MARKDLNQIPVRLKKYEGHGGIKIIAKWSISNSQLAFSYNADFEMLILQFTFISSWHPGILVAKPLARLLNLYAMI